MQPPLSSASPASSSPGRAAAAAGGKKPSFSSPSPSSFSPLEISTVIAPFADKLLDLTIGRYQVVEHGRPQDFFAFHAACREDLVQHLTSFLSVDVSQVAAAAAAANRKKKGTQRRGSSGAGEEGTEEEEVVDLDEEEAEFRDLQRRAELLVEKALPHHPAAASLLSLSSLPTTAAGAGSSGGQDVSSSLKPNSHHQNQSSESISAVSPPAAHNGYSQMHQSFQQQQQEGVVAGDDEGEQQQQQQNPQQQKAAWDALLAQRQSTTELFLRSTVAELIAALEVNESRLSQTEAKVGARDASLAQQRGMYLREVTYLREMIRQFREKGRCELPDIALLQSDQQLFHNNSKGEGGAGGDGNNSTCRGAAASDNVGASMIHEKREAMAKEEQRDAVEKQLRGQIHELNFKIRSLEAQSAIQQSLHQQVLTLQEQLKAQKQSAAKMEEIHEALRQEVATLTQQLESDPAAMLHAAAMTSRNHSSKADLSCDAAVQYEPPSPHRAGSVIDLSVEASFHEVFQNTSAAAAGGGGAPDNLLLGEGVRKSISVPQPPPPSLDLKGAKKDGGKAATTTTPRRGSDASLSGRKHNTPTNSPRSTTTGKGRGATAGESKKTLTPRRAAAIAAQAQQQVSPSSTPSLLPAAVNHSSGSGEHHPAAGASVSDGGASCTSPWHRDDDPHLHGGEPSTPQQRLPVPLPSASSFSANPSPTPSPSSQLSPMSGWQAEVKRLRAENLLLQERLAQHQQRQDAEEQHHQQPRGSSVTPSSTGLPNPPTTSATPAKLRLLQDELHKKNQLLDQKSAELAQLQSETMRWFQQYKERIPSSAAEVSDIHFPSLRSMRDALRGAVIEEKLYRHLSWKLIRDHQRYRHCQERHEEELTVAKGTRQIGPNPALATKLQRQQAAMVQCHEGKLERLRRARREARDKANGHWDEVLLYARRLFVSVQLCEKQMDDALPVETDLQTRGGEAPHERNHSAASSSHLVGGRFPSSAAVPHRSGASPLSVKMDRNGEEDPSSLIVEVPHIVPRAVNHVLLPANTTAAANGEQQQQEGLLLDTSQQQQQKSTRPSSAVGLHQAAAAVSGSTRKRPMSASVTRPVAAVAASRAGTYNNNHNTTISASQHHHYGSRAASQFHPADLRTATPSDRRRMILQALRGSRGPEQGPSSSSHPHYGSGPSLVTEVALNPPAHLDQPPPPQQQPYGNARPSSASAYHRRVYHDQNFQNSSPLRSAEQQQVQEDRDRARQSDLYRGSVLRHHGPILTTTMPQQGNNSGSRSDAVPPALPDDERVLQAVRNAGMIRTARLIGRFEKL